MMFRHILMLALAAMFTHQAILALRNQYVETFWRRYSRSSNPKAFGVAVTFYGVLAVANFILFFDWAL